MHPVMLPGSTIPDPLKSNYLVCQNFPGEPSAFAIRRVAQFLKEAPDPVAGTGIEVGENGGQVFLLDFLAGFLAGKNRIGPEVGSGQGEEFPSHIDQPAK